MHHQEPAGVGANTQWQGQGGARGGGGGAAVRAPPSSQQHTAPRRQEPGPSPGLQVQPSMGQLTSALKARVRLGWCCPELSCAGSPGVTELTH